MGGRALQRTRGRGISGVGKGPATTFEKEPVRTEKEPKTEKSPEEKSSKSSTIRKKEKVCRSRNSQGNLSVGTKCRGMLRGETFWRWRVRGFWGDQSGVCEKNSREGASGGSDERSPPKHIYRQKRLPKETMSVQNNKKEREKSMKFRWHAAGNVRAGG